MSSEPTLIIDDKKFDKERSIVIKYMNKLSGKEISPNEVISLLEDLAIISYTEGITYDDIIKEVYNKLNPSLFEKPEGDDN